MKILSMLFTTSRPLTAVFSLVLTLVGFRFWQPMAWSVALTSAVVYALITGHIMTYNDYVDRFRDRLKGKWFATLYEKELRLYYLVVAALILSGIISLGMIDTKVAVFCGAIWIIGLLYSHIPHWYIVNTELVAVCSASPVLLGIVYYGEIRFEPWWLFIIFVSVITIREVYKDIEDAPFDQGFKATIPLKRGIPFTVLGLFSLIYVPVGLLLAYPALWAKAIAFVFAPLAWAQAMLFARLFRWFDPDQRMREIDAGIKLCKGVLDWIIPGILVMAFVSEPPGWETDFFASAVFFGGLLAMVWSFGGRIRAYFAGLRAAWRCLSR